MLYEINILHLLLDEKAEDLYQLATYLSLTLRRVGLHTLFSPGSRSNKTLDSQFINHDSVGIPYTVVITPDALNNGIIGLRSRDTTLQVTPQNFNFK